MPTNIEWSDETWNPTTGCTQISPGCANCYAKTLAKRLKAMGQPRYQNDGGKGSGPGFALTLQPDALELPLHWKKPRRIFVNSMSDLFHEDVPDEYIDRVFAVMALTPQHTYQILTKRPERMREYMTKERTAHFADGSPVTPRNPYTSADFALWAAQAICDGGWTGDYPTGDSFDWPLPNVWLGCTVENQRWADERIPILLHTPAAVRFLSCEPLLGPVRLEEWLHDSNCPLSLPFDVPDSVCTCCDPREDHISWVIVGGESGPRHRPFDHEWARSIVAQCHEAEVACFVKQMGGARPGNKLEDLPEDLRVREFPR